MKQDKKENSKKNNHKLFRPRKKKSVEEDAAITYLQAQYDKIVPDEIRTFKDLPLSQKTLKGLKDNNYIKPTEIQRQSIGYALQGKDILGAAKTGSGKTLAFLVPVLEKLFCKKWSRLDGIGALVISPTRELAYQIYENLRKVGSYHDFSAGLIIGGQNLKFERKRMDQVNILICTPGRLLQHMDENPLFNCSTLEILVLDEADRCLDMGFETTMNAIIENLPPERQTLLFSATQTKSVKDLARLSLSFPTYVAPHEQEDTVTPESLQQSYIICEIEDKISVIWSFIRNHLKQKILIFMSTCKQVKFIYDLFCKLRPGISLLALYGTLHQEKREKIYNEFCRKSNVVLFATDLASRGLDFPRVNWVIQMDCPEDVETYIHRAGRTARGIFGRGEGLLMLLPHEEKITEDMKKSKIPINKISIDPSKINSPQRKIEGMISDSVELKKIAQRAFVSYVKSVFLMKNKEIFNPQLIDTDAYARSLGLIVPPIIKFMHKYKSTNNYTKTNDNDDNDLDEDDVDDVVHKLKSNNNYVSEEIVTDNDEEEKPAVKKDIQLNNMTENKKKNNFIKFQDFHIIDNDKNNCLQLKNKDFEIELPEELEVEIRGKTKKNEKPLTKAAAAKIILKKNIKVNTQIKFTENEDKSNDARSELTKECMKNVGLHMEQSIKVMQEQDKCDKQRYRVKVKAKHKEHKRKLKNKNNEEEGEQDDFGLQSESDGPDLSWLPDPDKIYKKGSESDGEESIGDRLSDEEASNDSDNQKFHRPMKHKVTQDKGIQQESEKPQKIRKVNALSTSLSVEEAEALAMQLLRQ